MKAHPHPYRRHQAGNTLMVTIVVTGIIGFLLLAYLGLVQNQNSSNMRSQAWNAAMPVVEAGIEEALAHLNTRGITNGSLACDGWVESGGQYTMTRAIGGNFYSVTIKNYTPGGSNTPIIESKGYVVRPTMFASAGGALVATIGVNTDATDYLGRGVRVQTRRRAIFAKGMVAKDSIDMNGNNVTTDSFNSLNPLYSINGLDTASKARDSGHFQSCSC